ncbi:uncharacterized protein TOT_020000516 [Theileria orientalis strain Shintoku]|uniref:IMS import disulfide relay-system CHCH-CHCH-like Cx9C domain-containing protein n=1 Tax=Theileria orientalis strain Shintoku TaxID=869250 RepID=J4D7L7_THEOR|nr:uncharacterized protein TOT_020000516 [Theileria orientalis strain Shintoku]PVC51564.1 hypothetical protein MACL_00001437 [Theileria orientalis]BAM40255.1 uncharacterized protein TOT_020000516 [Theileria orientalis strain Shintoku]|eukprot:XP_009690556.1 uncharacterized protein TOT_020000516 [Theileria orientalis strain Shintoku]
MSSNDDRKCAPELTTYYQCLSTSKRDLSKCQNQESELRKCSSTDPENNYCLNELVDLFHCTRNPDTNGCAKQFVTFRECNRPGGPEIIIKDNMYSVSPKHLDKYNLNSEVICPVKPPNRSCTVAKKVLDRMREACGFKNFEEKFTPQVKS